MSLRARKGVAIEAGSIRALKKKTLAKNQGLF